MSTIVMTKRHGVASSRSTMTGPSSGCRGRITASPVPRAMLANATRTSAPHVWIATGFRIDEKGYNGVEADRLEKRIRGSAAAEIALWRVAG